jgi:hypothetical protein
VRRDDTHIADFSGGSPGILILKFRLDARICEKISNRALDQRDADMGSTD